MKKFFMSVSLVAAMCVVMSSCLKNDDSSYVAPVTPAAQDSLLKAFMEAHLDFNMITQSDSLHLYDFNQQTGKYEVYGMLAPYLYYEIVDPGDMSAGSVEIPDSELGGRKTGNTVVYNTQSDSTLIVSASYTGSMLNGTVFDKTDGKNALLVVPGTVIAWRLLMGKVGRGGHIRILTPSAYGYFNVQKGDIPANSPLFFDVKVAGFIKNSYANGN